MNNPSLHLVISINKQSLAVYSAGQLVNEYPVSTARNGLGEIMDSGCTPRGEHVVAEKIGDGCPANTVFVGRLPTGEIYDSILRELHPGRDWIVTRILWLEGREEGRNKGGNVDTYKRHIYIHGSPDDVEMGRPGSHGCIRMCNSDVIELFDLTDTGTGVLIHA